MPRFRFTVRRMAIALAIVGLAFVVWAVGIFDRWSYQDAANHYRHYAEAYEDDDPLGKHYATCFGEEWDAYMEKVRADRIAHQADKNYRAKKAAEYHGLQRKYKQAAARPWPWLRMRLAPPLHP